MLNCIRKAATGSIKRLVLLQKCFEAITDKMLIGSMNDHKIISVVEILPLLNDRDSLLLAEQAH